MNYEFRANGTTKLVISPTNSLEREFFNALFRGEVDVTEVSGSNNQEIIISKKEKKKEDEVQP